jgi:hypothetical protein
MAEPVRIGTSGWNYDHWQGRFYPDDLPQSRWFDGRASSLPLCPRSIASSSPASDRFGRLLAFSRARREVRRQVSSEPFARLGELDRRGGRSPSGLRLFQQ